MLSGRPPINVLFFHERGNLIAEWTSDSPDSFDCFQTMGHVNMRFQAVLLVNAIGALLFGCSGFAQAGPLHDAVDRRDFVVAAKWLRTNPEMVHEKDFSV